MTTSGGGQVPSPSPSTPSVDPVDRLKTFLARMQSDAEIIRPPADASTVSAATEALGVQPAQIVKSLLFETRRGEFILVVAAGGSRVNRQRLADVAGLSHLKLATPPTVLEITGFAVGGMPPAGHERALDVVVDRAVLGQSVVFGGGGRSDLLLRIRPDEIVRLTNAVVADVADQET